MLLVSILAMESLAKKKSKTISPTACSPINSANLASWVKIYQILTIISKLLTSCLTAVKNMLSNIVKKYMRDPVKTYFGRLKIQVKF